MKKIFSLSVLFCMLLINTQAQSTDELLKKLEKQEKYNEHLKHRLDQLSKKVDDLLWFERVGDVAHIDKVYIYGPPKWKEKNPNGQDAGNPVKFWSYIFIPKDIDPDKQYPLIVFPHGGVHGDFGSYYTHIIRELMAQKYIVVAAEYRGSTGYGKEHYEKIDYGGLEIEDVHASRQHMIDNYDFVDKKRVGIVGWSHGGLIALMNIFEHPDDYQVAYAGVPVSDLIARIGYRGQEYRDLYEADYHIGESAEANINEYRRRSPAWNAHKKDDTPLMITTNTNDADVNSLEVEHLIKSLKAEGKNFEYKIYENLPGGHSFERQDSKTAKEIRLKTYTFLAKYLKPEFQFKSLKDLNKAGYKF